MSDFTRNHTLIFGTLFLTGAGLLSRILGFFYRIFLSRAIGAEGLGIYQMIFPIYGICFSLCAGSIQTAISRLTAADPKQAKRTLFTGFLLSFSLSLILAGLIFHLSDVLAVHILMEPQCAPLLPALALSIPFSAVHACFCGYYYGKEQVRIPAAAQLMEQCIRIASVFSLSAVWTAKGQELTAKIAVFGLLIGEIGSALFAAACFFLLVKKESRLQASPPETNFTLSAFTSHFFETAKPLILLAAPLMANRLIMNLLQSAEAILIPNRLESFGLTTSQAVSLYGTLTGMAMPFIMFPSAIVNSLAVVLLPTVARQQAANNRTGIVKNLSISFQCSLSMGILCIGVFTCFGNALGAAVFQNEDAGAFITILAWLCPFLYLATTMGSVLNGLGKTTATFFHHLIALIIRLLFVFFGIPVFGIHACLWGMLVSEILLTLLHWHSLWRELAFSPNMWDGIVKPAFCLLTALGICRLIPEALPGIARISPFFSTVISIGFLSICYLLLLLLFLRPGKLLSHSS